MVLMFSQRLLYQRLLGMGRSDGTVHTVVVEGLVTVHTRNMSQVAYIGTCPKAHSFPSKISVLRSVVELAHSTVWDTLLFSTSDATASPTSK